jgi:MFS family permease
LVKTGRPRIFYGYIIVIASLVMLFLMHGINVTFGVFFNPLQREFGWSRTEISVALSLSSLLLGLFGIVSGRLNDRFGPRIVIAASAVILGLGYLLTSQMQAVWQFYLFYGVIVSIGTSSGDVSTLSTTARWFIGRRGIMSGLVKAGTGAGMLIMPLVANWLISDYGWRNSYIILGIVCAVGILLIAQLFRRDPAQNGLKPYGHHEGDANNVKFMESGFSLREVIHTRQFWMLGATYFLIIYCANSIITHITPHALDLGLSTTTAASMISFIGGASIIGRLVMGSTGDRIGNRRALIICFLIYVTALGWLQFAKELWTLYLFTVVYGFAHGGFFALTSPLVAELFGTKSHGVIFGIVLFLGTIGGAIGPTVTGRLFDVRGSYQLAFLILVAVSVTGLVMSSFLRPVKVKSV